MSLSSSASPRATEPNIRPQVGHPLRLGRRRRQHRVSPVPILDVGRRYDHGEEQAFRIHQDMPLAARHARAPVGAARPPFSVVLTTGLSMITALGAGARCRRRVAMIGSQPPSLRHFQK